MVNVKKKLHLTITSVSMLALLAACGGNSNPPAASPGTNGDSGSGETIELTYWDGTWAEEITPELIKEFEEANPGIKINVEYFPWDGMQDKYLVALRNDSGPDIINLAVDWTVPFAAMGKLQSIDEYIDKYDVDMNDFYDGPLQTLIYQDQYYALPYRSEANALFYNKELFEEAGLDPNQAPETWEDVIAFSKQIHEQTGNYGFGQSGNEFGNFTAQLYYLIYSNGGSVLNEDNTKSALLSPEAIEASQLFVDLYRTHKASPESTLENNNTVNRNLFINGQVAMFISGNYDVDAIREANPELDFGTAPQPKMKELTPILGGWSVGVTNTAKDAEAAFKFVEFLASPEVSPRYSITFSSRASAADNEKYQTEELKPFLESLNYAVPMPPIPQWTQIKQIVYNNLQAAMIGDVSVEDALTVASHEIDEALSN